MRMILQIDGNHYLLPDCDHIAGGAPLVGRVVHLLANAARVRGYPYSEKETIKLDADPPSVSLMSHFGEIQIEELKAAD